jgi:hypothetical protein
VISNLQTQNAEQNALYVLAFSLLPICFTIPFVFVFPMGPLMSTLGITSLLISTGRARYFSHQSSSMSPSSPMSSLGNTRRPGKAMGLLAWTQLTSFENRVLDNIPEGGPLRKALPRLNVAICALLSSTVVLLYLTTSRDRRDPTMATTSVCTLLPVIAAVVVELAVRSMQDVDKGIGELEGLKYRYKGA